VSGFIFQTKFEFFALTQSKSCSVAHKGNFSHLLYFWKQRYGQFLIK